MKKLAFILISLFLLNLTVFADTSVYSDNSRFGLKNNTDVITKAKYKKLVRLGNTAWIFQERTKFGCSL